jgi:hypothetical protein
MNHIIIIIPAAQYESLPDAVQGALMGMVADFVKDKTASPISGVPMLRGTDTVWVACYWRDAVEDDLTQGVIDSLHPMLATYGVEVVGCDDPASALAERGIIAPQVEI